MNTIAIRECMQEDLDDILSLHRQWFNDDITYGLTPADRSYLESKLGEYFLVAELDSKIIGFIYGTIHKAKNMAVIKDGEFYIEIDDIYTLPEYRGNGIGSLLLSKILEISKQNEIERSLIYSSTKDMDSIINFYKKHDYKTWYIQMFK
jgi:ribosomal protein S18 acetylase RimI-like enzyme